jgi:hypothetical protein
MRAPLRAALVAALSLQTVIAVGRASKEPDFFCPCNISPATLRPGLVGVHYQQVFTIGGTEIVCHESWTWTHSGQLPPGLTLTGQTLSGTPTTPGTFSFFVSAFRIGCLISRNYTMTVTAPTPRVVGIAPSSGSASGGSPITVSGYGFQPGATLTIGGVLAGNVVVVSDTEITGSAPGLTAGTLNAVAVTGAASLVNGWMADFLDVPQGNQFHDSVESIFRAGITGGCTGGNYCPDDPVTRAQMAVFILKGEHGGIYTPPACTATIFGDEPCPGGPFVDWVNQAASEGITGGCGNGNYCPNDAITRGQMSVFLLKGQHGGAYTPPACTATMFADEPCPGGPFVDWVNQLASEQITGGCGNGNYCPDDPVTRGEMAVLLTKTFGL